MTVEEHRAAYRAVMAVLPGTVHISHENESNVHWEIPEVYMPEVAIGPVTGCKVCGDPPPGPSLTEKCRDLHEVCKCGARYDRPKNPGCRRRKHPKGEK